MTDQPDTANVRLQEIAAHLDSLGDLLLKLAQSNEGKDGDDLVLAGTFRNSVENEKEALDDVITELERPKMHGAT